MVPVPAPMIWPVTVTEWLPASSTSITTVREFVAGKSEEHIRDPAEQWTFPPFPSGMSDHLGQSFAWAKSGAKAGQ